MNKRPLCAVILAAGAGSRMKSSRPKPLHMLCGRPMVAHVLGALKDVPVQWTVVVVGRQSEQMSRTLNEYSGGTPIHYVEQAQQNGTGDAVATALSSLPREVSDESEDADMLILPSDIPLLEADAVASLLQKHYETDAAATLLTAELDDPTGYGRIIRTKDRVSRIVEQTDATPQERDVKEVNTSVYCFRTSLLGPALRRITDRNEQGEYYLTDVIEVLAKAGHRVESMIAPDAAPAVGVNDRLQLSIAEAVLRKRINEKWMRAGVTMIDPEHTYVDLAVELAQDVSLLPGTRLQGHTKVGSGSQIGPECHLVDTTVGENAVVRRTDSVGANIGSGAIVGPYAMLRPGEKIEPDVETGPFFSVNSQPFQ